MYESHSLRYDTSDVLLLSDAQIQIQCIYRFFQFCTCDIFGNFDRNVL